MPKLHVNIDHVATLRQARREAFPEPIEWALRAERAGAQGITAHLRTDRRHVQDADIRALQRRIATRLNFEMSLDPGIVEIALRTKPAAVCLVPENRAEVTTEGGLDVAREHERLLSTVPRLARIGCEVSLFVDPDLEQIEAAAEVGAEFVELHTGSYARAVGARRKTELRRLVLAAERAHALGLRVNAGHGLDYDNVEPIAALPHVEELNIGFAIVARAVFTGVDEAVGTMARLVRGERVASAGRTARTASTSRTVKTVGMLKPARAAKATRTGQNGHTGQKESSVRNGPSGRKPRVRPRRAASSTTTAPAPRRRSSR